MTRRPLCLRKNYTGGVNLISSTYDKFMVKTIILDHLKFQSIDFLEELLKY